MRRWEPKRERWDLCTLLLSGECFFSGHAPSTPSRVSSLAETSFLVMAVVVVVTEVWLGFRGIRSDKGRTKSPESGPRGSPVTRGS